MSKAHRWVAVSSYVLSDEEARQAMTANQTPIIFGAHNLMDVAVGCYDCEAPWELVNDKPCSATEEEESDMSPNVSLRSRVTSESVTVALSARHNHPLDGMSRRDCPACKVLRGAR